EVARALGAPLDVVLVRKIGAPGQEELALGAIADGEQPDLVVDPAIIAALPSISPDVPRSSWTTGWQRAPPPARRCAPRAIAGRRGWCWLFRSHRPTRSQDWNATWTLLSAWTA